MDNDILEIVNAINVPGFFITTECTRQKDRIPEGIEEFIHSKLKLINEGVRSRKFVFEKEGWRLVFTFFPTDKVVEERYALKNRVYKGR